MSLRLIVAAGAILGLLWAGVSLAGEARGTPASSAPSLHVSRPGDPADPRAPALEGAVPEYRLDAQGAERSLAWDGMRMLLSLAAVLVLLGGGVKVLRRWPGLAGRQGVVEELQVLGRVALTAKEAICLIRAGTEVLVVGVSPAGVTLLTRLEAGAAESARLASPTSGPRTTSEGRSAYASRLRELTARVREVQAVWGIGKGTLRGDR